MPTKFFLVATVLAVLSANGHAQSISAEQPEDWTDWASVSVAWEHPSPNEETDWIAAFLSDWEATYISWHSLNESINWDPSDTSGSMSINLLNGRHPYEFRYYRNNDIIKTSNIIYPLGETPRQGHLSLVPGYSNQMRISWVNNISNDQIVYWGTDINNLEFNSISNDIITDTYTNLDFTTCMGIDEIEPLSESFANLSIHNNRCGYNCYDDPTSSQLFLDPGYLHSYIMNNLQSGIKYYYQYGTNNGMLSTGGGINSFIAPRQPGDMTSFTFLVTADAGIGAIPLEEQGSATHNDPPINGADQVYTAMINDPLTGEDELILLNGDISYARGWAWIWERYMYMIEPLTTQLPFMVSVGNHEVDTHENTLSLASGGDSGGECGVTTMKRFPYFNSLQEMWYSFNYGSVHYIILSSESPTSNQITFFNNDLATNFNRTLTPWLIVLLHRPLFGSGYLDELDLQLQSTWHHLFVDNNVDLVLTGHAHYYERICPVINNTACSTERDRPIYVIDGSAGAEFDPTTPTDPSPITEYKDFDDWGYSRITINNQIGLTWSHYHTNNEIVDEVTLPPMNWGQEGFDERENK